MIKIEGELKSDKTYIKINKLLPILVLIAICSLGIGYASLNAINLNVDGILGAFAQRGVFISNVVDELGNEISGFYNNTILNSTIELSPTDLRSTKTYNVTVYNNTNSTYYYSSDICDQTDTQFYSNQDITYSITGIAENEELASHASTTFQITFKYKENISEITNNTLTSCIKFLFKDSVTSFDLQDIQSGQPFNLGEVEFDGGNETFYAELNVTDIPSTAINENLITIGQYISQWTIPSTLPGAVNLHIYYPSNDGKIVISPIIQGDRHLQFKKTYSKLQDNGIIKIAFNSNGLYMNGECVMDSNSFGMGTTLYDKQTTRTLEEYLQLFFSKWQGNLTVEVGSEEGSNRSHAKYKTVEIHKRKMTASEMVELTTVVLGDIPLEDITYAEVLDEPFVATGNVFGFDTPGYTSLTTHTLYAEIDISSVGPTRSKENIISIGHDIPEWAPLLNNSANIHFYYPNTDGSLILAITLKNNGFKQWNVPLSAINATESKILKIAINANGLYINGVSLISSGSVNQDIIQFSTTTGFEMVPFLRETFNRLKLGENPIQVGSKQGDNKSTATYNMIRLYDDVISHEDMIRLTTDAVN